MILILAISLSLVLVQADILNELGKLGQEFGTENCSQDRYNELLQEEHKCIHNEQAECSKIWGTH